jgi:hypothetical protein
MSFYFTMIQKDHYLKISDEQISQIRQAFDVYTKKFFNNDPLHNQHIEIKRFHTRKVCENILDIARSLEMNSEQQNFAELLAWMHDIGRFEQYRKYQTFSDSNSENHSILAIKTIKKENLLASLTKEQTDVIFHTILNHNIRLVPNNEEPIIDFYSRLLRDADKLDIWRITIEMDIMFKLEKISLPGSYSVPAIFLIEFANRRPLRMEQASNIYDTTLLRLSWIYDLNFTRSFKLIIDRGIVDKLLKKVPGSAELEQIRMLVFQYLSQKCP